VSIELLPTEIVRKLEAMDDEAEEEAIVTTAPVNECIGVGTNIGVCTYSVAPIPSGWGAVSPRRAGLLVAPRDGAPTFTLGGVLVTAGVRVTLGSLGRAEQCMPELRRLAAVRRRRQQPRHQVSSRGGASQLRIITMHRLEMSSRLMSSTPSARVDPRARAPLSSRRGATARSGREGACPHTAPELGASPGPHAPASHAPARAPPTPAPPAPPRTASGAAASGPGAPTSWPRPLRLNISRNMTNTSKLKTPGQWAAAEPLRVLGSTIYI
jgi:hypothetical protein